MILSARYVDGELLLNGPVSLNKPIIGGVTILPDGFPETTIHKLPRPSNAISPVLYTEITALISFPFLSIILFAVKFHFLSVLL